MSDDSSCGRPPLNKNENMSIDHTPPSTFLANTVRDSSTRRTFILGAAVGGVLVSAANAIGAQPVSSARTRTANLPSPMEEQRDRIAVADLVVRERAARDAGQWAEMAACYHPDSMIEVAWFKGSGAYFIELSKKNVSADRLSLHQMGPSIVTVNNDRAIAETPTQLVGFVALDGVDVCLTNFARLLWRVQRVGDQWLIAGLRMIYVRDMLTPCNPSRVPAINEEELSRYRRSYRYESYIFARMAHPVSDDLPGMDRPDTVTALRAGETAWLEGAADAVKRPGSTTD